MGSPSVNNKHSAVLARCNEKLQELNLSTKPLKFRSFDQFYQYHSYKQREQTDLAIAKNACMLKAVVVKKVGEFKPTDKVLNERENLLIQQSDVDTCRKHENIIKKEPILQPEILKGRVQRLCKIFQKAHVDSNYKNVLKQTIEKNIHCKNTPRKSPRIKITPHLHATSTRFVETQKPTESKPESSVTEPCSNDSPAVVAPPTPVNQPVLEFTIQDTPEDSCEFSSEDQDDVDMLVQDVLNRFLNDEEFCKNFPSLIRDMSLSLITESDPQILFKLIEDIQQLISDENDDISPINKQNLDFDWFFTTENVCEFNLDSPTCSGTITPTHEVDLVPSNLRNEKFKEHFKWINNI
ncbi:hypothetical protein BdWA1_001828 [Babesia duncani]|uniref:Uncharacterized protein n=1 Tax=Babesia duncani TaxID=323732 RepID=A0AAD9PL59_9APIC|nr:hypothetical protein BdWA1_001828 [Babesia duncani]